MRKSGYFEALNLTPYWLAHIIANLIENPQAYIIELHEILAVDDIATDLCNRFPRKSNLHLFIGRIFEGIIYEPTEEATDTLRAFLTLLGAPKDWFEGIDDEGPGEIIFTELYEKGYNRLVEEVFHILFRDVGLLAKFNGITAAHISSFGEKMHSEDVRFTERGKLQRTTIPSFVRDVIYFRDGGECRTCKLSINRELSPEARERYDHIIPLAQGGANDITNIQLLCETCNAAKSDKLDAVSKLYPMAYKNSID